jgi:hypothetical protein
MNKHQLHQHNRPVKPEAAYIKNIAIRHGEISIVTSDHAEATMRHSSKLAASIQQIGVGVLLINCGMSDRRFREHFKEQHKEIYHNPRLILTSRHKGNLVAERDGIDQTVLHGKIGVVIIAGWEFASDCYKRRNRLITYLRELMAEQDVAVVIYAHNAKDPSAGKIDHGGLGKLSLLAYAVAKIDAAELLEAFVEEKKRMVVQTHAEQMELERGAREFVKKIKKIRGIAPDDEDDGGFVMAEAA